MKEVMKKIKTELSKIKMEQEKLSELEDNSKKLKEEAKKLEEERNQITDTESGFYKDITKQYEEKYKEFRQADIERMNEDRHINQLISTKKEAIVSEIQRKMKFIDENRKNVSNENLDMLKKERKNLEDAVIRDIANGISDSDQIQQFRKKKIDELNLKIEDIYKLNNILDGKEPKDKFIEFESLLKSVKDNFNRDNISKFMEDFEKEKESEPESQTEPIIKPETKSQTEPIIKPETKSQPEPIIKPETKSQPEPIAKPETQSPPQSKYNMILDISENTISVNKNEEGYYKEKLKNKKEIIEEYGLNSYFINDKKSEKLVDYALISALEKIDDKDSSLVKSYLNIIKYGKTQSDEVKESIEKLNKAVDIEYKFDKGEGILLNLREKKIARFAKKMGIASLDGISEKSSLDKITDKAKEIFSKVKNRNLFSFRKEPEALNSAEETKEPGSKKFGFEYEVDEDVKQNINNVSKQYSEQEKEEERHIAEEVEKIQKQEEEELDR